MSIAKAVSSLTEPEFTPYQQSTKIPTEDAVDALEEKYGVAGTEDSDGVRYYLVEVALGVVKDLFANPATFPAAKCTYMSADGLIVTDTVRAAPTPDGGLDPVTRLVPSGVTSRNEGRPASATEWESYAPILRSAHGVSLSD